MLRWAAALFVLALMTGALGFGGIAGAATGIARILFFVFLIALLVSGIAYAVRGRPPL